MSCGPRYRATSLEFSSGMALGAPLMLVFASRLVLRGDGALSTHRGRGLMVSGYKKGFQVS